MLAQEKYDPLQPDKVCRHYSQPPDCCKKYSILNKGIKTCCAQVSLKTKGGIRLAVLSVRHQENGLLKNENSHILPGLLN